MQTTLCLVCAPHVRMITQHAGGYGISESNVGKDAALCLFQYKLLAIATGTF